MFSKSLVCLIALALVAGARAEPEDSDFEADIAALTEHEGIKIKTFDESQVGFDNRDDMFYFQDNHVNELFSRKKFVNGLITLAGQQTDKLNQRVAPSSYPFGVAQRATKNSGTLSERWDVKDVPETQVQLFAIYHGEGGTFVLNKVRAHLLRLMANSLQEFLPKLDRSLQSDAKENPRLVNEVHDELKRAAEEVFADVDQSIRRSMKDNDDSWASATVVLVTPAAVVTIAVGDSQVLGYDDSTTIQRLTNFHDDVSAKNVFGARKTRQHSVCKPHVEIFSREELQLQLVVLESPALVQNVDNYSLFRIVLGEVSLDNEQQLYSNSLSRILETASKKVSPMTRIFNGPDFSAMLIGLERDYSNIH